MANAARERSDTVAGADALDAAECHVLVVDDSKAQRLVAMRRLQVLGYRVSGAEDGEDALSRIAEGGIDIVLSDWMMPRLDGIGLCRSIRSFGDSGYIYFVLMTVRSEHQSLAEGLEAGADDFIAKPLSEEELSARLSAGRRLTHLHRRLNDAHQRAEDARQSVERLYGQIQQDLKVASALQHATLPARSDVVNGCPVAGLCRFAGHVGGDHIGWVAIGPDAVGIFAIDVAGHGIASCLLALRLAALMTVDRLDSGTAGRTEGLGDALPVPPEDVLYALNALRFGGEEHDLYYTMAYGVLTPSTGEVRMATAGYWPPAILSPEGTVRFVETAGGPPLAMFEDSRFSSSSFHIAPGERLILYSDGLPEAALPANGGLLGRAGLAALISSEQHRPTAELPEAIWTHAATWPDPTAGPRDVIGDGNAETAVAGASPRGLTIDDDVSMLVIERPLGLCP
ncbi:MAG: fused response regulator/phosphatase [Pseudomonadota bacterium]